MTSKYGDMVKSLKKIYSLKCLYFKISKRIKHKIELFASREKKKTAGSPSKETRGK